MNAITHSFRSLPEEPDHGDARPQNHKSPGILRFITCGSVDDGKSTLIGRMLIEAGAVYEDQLASLRSDSAKHGTTSEEIDAALLVDGLEEERQQGITIDVAYRYFATPRRKFIIADTPGHEQFTRNMATGASTADLAILLVDASKGILTQTKRHAFVVSLLGIKHAILAVNKMDLVDYSQSVFDKICDDFANFSAALKLTHVSPVPLSALRGENVAVASEQMNWYTGKPLLELLESVHTECQEKHQAFRFPIQWVSRPTDKFRGYSGTVAAGQVQVGDAVTVLPSGKQTQVRRIIYSHGAEDRAEYGRSTTLVLEDELDISRGDMLVASDELSQVSQTADAMLIWMSEKPLVPGRSYWVKHTTKRLSAEVEMVHYEMDVNTLQRRQASSLKLNQIGFCRLRTGEPLCYDDYRRNRQTGSFILVDKVTCETIAAGMLLQADSETSDGDSWYARPANIRMEPYKSMITDEQRRQRTSQKPFTLLITGLSGSGKTTLMQHLEKQLFQDGKTCLILDGGDLRGGLNRDLGFSSEDRSENLRRAAEIARLANRAGQICLAAFVAPQQKIRARVRDLIGLEHYFHVHLTTPLETCRERDLSGQYALADRGEIHDFPGVSGAYDDPSDADLRLDGSQFTSEELCHSVISALQGRGLL
ncbi:MAG: sulfate adenylyltransferase subunit CysN [bacterium]|nr:sulfate adenylyltransferase subunit CysN [bacterium]